MALILVLLTLLILLISHLLILPLSKKRPVFVKGFEGSFFVLIIFALIAAIIHPLLYILALVLTIFIYYTKSWIVYGVSKENIIVALANAIKACNSTSSKRKGNFTINDDLSVRIIRIGGNLYIIEYKGRFSKKARLTQEIFRKFIQNYFI